MNKQLNSQRIEEINKNRRAVSTLTRVAIFCARQDIALRGHRESETVKQNKHKGDNNNCSTDSFNRGNFLELLELLQMDQQK